MPGLTVYINTPKYLSFLPQAVSRQVNSLLQSEFSTGFDLVLPLSIYSILVFTKVIQ
jgi:hypothetical protein